VSKPFPALTIYQPWASLIAYGFKEFETRGWPAPQKYVGQLIAIHAAKQWTNQEQRWLKVYKQKFPEIGDLPVPRGCIIAMCRLIEVVPADLLRDTVNPRERSMGGYEEAGRYGWRLAVVKRAEPPIPAQGKQGIWLWTKDAP
jgi:activating signal cointegrator 1